MFLFAGGEHAAEAAHGAADAHEAVSPFAQEHGTWLDPLGVALGICNPAKHHHNCWVLVALLVAILLAAFAVVASRNMQIIPRGKQNILEMIVEGFNNFTKSIAGNQAVKYAPLVGTFFLFIMCLNLIGLIPGMVSPTANPNVTISLALIAFVAVQFIAVKENGIIGYLNHLGQEPDKLPKFLWPLVPMFFAIHLVGEIARPISLSMRLLGNIFGEDTVLVALALLAANLGLPSLFKFTPFQFPIQVLAILTSVIQALVFSALLAVYISLVMPHEHHGEQEHH